ncbi:hypothetical protein [Pseudomonas fluorescens]|jgi:hypothetical protein|uniref:hypothetical protein n=1 Tax=Pseudomonas fluorescens TaxID=294 RepID=UPI001430DF20|nr:hypothetical protein [Pseudomonas fluorescens]
MNDEIAPMYGGINGDRTLFQLIAAVCVKRLSRGKRLSRFSDTVNFSQRNALGVDLA